MEGFGHQPARGTKAVLTQSRDLYHSKDLVRDSRRFFDSVVMRACHFAVRRKILMAEHRIEVLRFLNDESLDQDMRRNAGLRGYVLGINDMDAQGTLTRILLKELSDLGPRLSPRLSEIQAERESREFADKLILLARKQPEIDVDPSCEGEKIRVGVMPIALANRIVNMGGDEGKDVIQIIDEILGQVGPNAKILPIRPIRDRMTADEIIKIIGAIASVVAIVADLLQSDGELDPVRLKKHRKFLEECLAELQDQGRSPGRIHGCSKHVRTFYRVNEIEIPRPELPRPIVVSRDRAPNPDELARLVDVADLREKVILSMLALGGFREGTLVRLRYSHVREDLEKGIVPLHIHVEAAITKGKYDDYDTFLAAGAVQYVRLYLDARRQGNLHPEIPTEEISDDSPLIRDEMHAVPRPIGEKQLYKLIHSLYFKAGLLRKNHNGGYDLRVHSLRKFFKTQLMALGVQPDYIDYMMGHTVDTYYDLQSKGVEFLRNLYASAGLSIRPRSQLTKIDMLKEMIHAWGLEPEKILTRGALAEPHRSYANPEEHERHQARILLDALRENLKNDVLASLQISNPKHSPG